MNHRLPVRPASRIVMLHRRLPAVAGSSAGCGSAYWLLEVQLGYPSFEQSCSLENRLVADSTQVALCCWPGCEQTIGRLLRLYQRSCRNRSSSAVVVSEANVPIQACSPNVQKQQNEWMKYGEARASHGLLSTCCVGECVVRRIPC